MRASRTSGHQQDHEADGTGYERVDTPISCLLTRFHLRSAWSLIGFYRTYRYVRRQATSRPGLLATAFLIENARTCYTLSFWKDADAIREFNTHARAHVSAANWSFGRLVFEAGRPELWSAQFRLSAVSPHNLSWAPLAREIISRSLSKELEPCDVA